jgi:hemerythrin
MPLMIWNDRLSVGVESLDNDHKRLLRMINDIYDLLLGERGPETLAQTLDGLVDYIAIHFKREEDYFALTGYADAEAHRLEHANMTAWVGQMRERLLAGQSSGMAQEILSFLRDWLFDHIMASDRKYMVHFHKSGVR